MFSYTQASFILPMPDHVYYSILIIFRKVILPLARCELPDILRHILVGVVLAIFCALLLSHVEMLGTFVKTIFCANQIDNTLFQTARYHYRLFYNKHQSS